MDNLSPSWTDRPAIMTGSFLRAIKIDPYYWPNRLLPLVSYASLALLMLMLMLVLRLRRGSPARSW